MLSGWYADRAGPSDVEQLEMRALCRLELIFFAIRAQSQTPTTLGSNCA